MSYLSLFSEGPGESREAGAWGDQIEDDNGHGGDSDNERPGGTLRHTVTLARVRNWLRNLLEITKICS
jgi:hypothetical protein